MRGPPAQLKELARFDLNRQRARGVPELLLGNHQNTLGLGGTAFQFVDGNGGEEEVTLAEDQNTIQPQSKGLQYTASGYRSSAHFQAPGGGIITERDPYLIPEREPNFGPRESVSAKPRMPRRMIYRDGCYRRELSFDGRGTPYYEY